MIYRNNCLRFFCQVQWSGEEQYDVPCNDTHAYDIDNNIALIFILISQEDSDASDVP